MRSVVKLWAWIEIVAYRWLARPRYRHVGPCGSETGSSSFPPRIFCAWAFVTSAHGLPLLPWFGVVLIGLFFGNVIYADGRRSSSLPNKAPLVARPLLPPGRNSLFIYLIHQPIVIALLVLTGIISINFL